MKFVKKKMQHLKDSLPFLKAVAQLDGNQSAKLLLIANKTQIHCVTEICHNIIAEVLQLSPAEKEELKSYKTVIRTLAHPPRGIKYLQKYMSARVNAIRTILLIVLPQIEQALT